jgi:dihydroorotase
MNDLVLKGGRVIDPSQGLDKVTDIAFTGGKVAAIGDHLSGKDVRDVTGKIVTPGLIDLHTHVYWGGTSLGVEAELLARSGGVTTFIDAGSAGPGNFHGFRRHVIERSPVRILPYLNIAFPGIFAFSKSVMLGENVDMRLIDAREAARVAREHKDVVLGIKVRVGRSASGDSGVKPLDIALDVAEETGLPVMAHLDAPPPSRREVLERLRPGDVLTHCFRPFPNAPVRPDGGVREEVLAARARGVIFDIGHGAGSFGFGTTRAMLAAGFLPDVISSDVHVISIEGPAFDLLTTMSKFLCLGVDLATVVKLATSGAAAAIKRPDLGTLRVGHQGEATVIEQANGRFDFADSIGERLVGDKRLVSAGVVLAGRWWHPA